MFWDDEIENHFHLVHRCLAITLSLTATCDTPKTGHWKCKPGRKKLSQEDHSMRPWPIPLNTLPSEGQ